VEWTERPAAFKNADPRSMIAGFWESQGRPTTKYSGRHTECACYNGALAETVPPKTAFLVLRLWRGLETFGRAGGGDPSGARRPAPIESGRHTECACYNGALAQPVPAGARD
jgi:hypothetical protein